MTCASPAKWETLVAYWAGDLDASAENALETHLMGCVACTAQSARVAAIADTLHGMIPPIVTRSRVEELRARGLRVREDAFEPSDSRGVLFPAELDLLVFRLGGLELSGATNVSFQLRVHGTSHVLAEIPSAPFDPAEGAVLLVCQPHYASLPGHLDAEVRVRGGDGAERVATYTIDHRFER